MSDKYRSWDESRSPQWKYMLQRESAQRRKTRKEIERERARKALEEGAPPKARIGQKKGRGSKNVKRYVRIKNSIAGTISNKLTLELQHNDTDTITRLSTEPKEQE